MKLTGHCPAIREVATRVGTGQCRAHVSNPAVSHVGVYPLTDAQRYMDNNAPRSIHSKHKYPMGDCLSQLGHIHRTDTDIKILYAFCWHGMVCYRVREGHKAQCQCQAIS